MKKFLSEVAAIGEHVKFIPAKQNAAVPKRLSGYFTDQRYNLKEMCDWRIFGIGDEKDGKSLELVAVEGFKSLALNGQSGYSYGPAAMMELCKELEENRGGNRILARSIGYSYPDLTTELSQLNDGRWTRTFDCDIMKNDVKKLKTCGLMPKNEWVWLPCTVQHQKNDLSTYIVKALHISGCIADTKALYFKQGEVVKEEFHVCAVLPFLSIPANAYAVSGNGSEEMPYEIEF